MIIIEYNKTDKAEVKIFISKTIEGIFGTEARGLEDLENIKENFEKFWIAKENNKIIGTIGLKNEEKERKHRVTRMYVKESLRGKGIGKELMRKLSSYCKDKKINSLFLTTYKQMNSSEFYKKMGFKETKIEGNVIRMERRV